MAVVSCREIWRGRGGRFAGLLDYELTRTFRVVTDNAYDDTTVILASGFLPAMHVADTISPALTVRGYNFRQENESPKLWLIDVQYSSRPDNPDAPDDDVPPLDRPVKITWSGEERQVPVETDINGKPILNSANDFFDDPVLKDDQRLVAQITAKVAGVPTWIGSYRGTVNASAIVIGGYPVAARCAMFKIRSISEPKIEQGQEYVEFVFSLHINEDTWDVALIDRGWNEKDGKGGKTPIFVNGETPDAPQLLNGAGLAQDRELNTGVELTFRIYPGADYSVLPGITT